MTWSPGGRLTISPVRMVLIFPACIVNFSDYIAHLGEAFFKQYWEHFDSNLMESFSLDRLVRAMCGVIQIHISAPERIRTEINGESM